MDRGAWWVRVQNSIPVTGKGHLSMASSQKVCKEMTDNGDGTSQVVRWVRISLPMQGTRVQSLAWEDPTCRGATKPVCLEHVLCNKRNHHNEKPAGHK